MLTEGCHMNGRHNDAIWLANLRTLWIRSKVPHSALDLVVSVRIQLLIPKVERQKTLYVFLIGLLIIAIVGTQ